MRFSACVCLFTFLLFLLGRGCYLNLLGFIHIVNQRRKLFKDRLRTKGAAGIHILRDKGTLKFIDLLRQLRSKQDYIGLLGKAS